MTKITVFGKCLAPDGLSQQTVVGHHGLRTRSWATRPEALRSRQPRSKVNVEHERTLGSLVALERDQAGLWATCEIEASQPRLVQLTCGEWYYSPEITAVEDGADRVDVELTGIALVRRPAGIGLSPVVVLDGKLDPYQINNRWHHLPQPVRERLHRAALQTRSRDRMLTVITDRAPATNLDRLVGRSVNTLTPVEHQMLAEAADEAWMHRPLRHSGTYKGIYSVR